MLAVDINTHTTAAKAAPRLLPARPNSLCLFIRCDADNQQGMDHVSRRQVNSFPPRACESRHFVYSNNREGRWRMKTLVGSIAVLFLLANASSQAAEKVQGDLLELHSCQLYI